jgi:hypothetical protein
LTVLRRTLYRYAAWDTPWRVSPSRSPGRYNADGDPPVQYWSTHPLGPAAEMIRVDGATSLEHLRDVQLRLWAAQVIIDDLIEVDFDNAPDHGIDPEALVGEDYEPTQALARRLRLNGADGLIAPSAALPGTQTVVIFGPKLLFPYLYDPIDVEQVPTAHVADSSPPNELLPHVRHRGDLHASLSAWQEHGSTDPLLDPPIDKP